MSSGERLRVDVILAWKLSIQSGDGIEMINTAFFAF